MDESTKPVEFRQHRIELLLRAEEPIAHHEGSVGNVGIIMRRTCFLPNGRKTKVPIITADTLRHGMREASALATLEAAGLLDAVHGESALRLMFSGGQMLKSTDTLRLDDYREMIELFPPLALLGGCAGNRIIPGRMSVGDAWLVCEESRHRLPGWVTEKLDEDGVQCNGARAHVERVQRVRMDPMLQPQHRALLSAGEREAVEGRLVRSDDAARDDDDAEKLRTKSTMLPFAFETIAAGSLFFARVDARTTNLLESDTLAVTIAAWLHNARVGGKKGTGHGLVRLVAARGFERSQTAEPTLSALALGETPAEIERYRAHIAARAERLGVWLAGVAA